MPPRRLTDEQLAELKFDDCRVCKNVLTRKCRGCGAGENFEDADEPEDIFSVFSRQG